MATDRRIQRTQDQLRQALAELILPRGYESISVRELAARAGVGYATFFRHYPTKDALLLNLLQRSIQDLEQLPPQRMGQIYAEMSMRPFTALAGQDV